MNNLKVGMKVWFGRENGEQTLGTIEKINRETVKVRQEEARGTMRAYPVGTIWKVAMKFCRPVEGGRSEAAVLSDIARAYEALKGLFGEIGREVSAEEAARHGGK